MVNLKDSQLRGKGIFGRYFQISSNRGIKIIGRGYKSLDHLFGGAGWWEAYQEAENLRSAQKSRITPLFFNLKPVLYKGKFFPGIEMEHISGKTLAGYLKARGELWKQGSRLYISPIGRISHKKTIHSLPLKKFLKYRLDRSGLKHYDLHGDNIFISKKNGIRVIDLSPSHFRVKS